MKVNVTKSMFRDEFWRFEERRGTFSYKGLGYLYRYLEELEPEYELDVVSLCCEYSEDSIEDALAQYDLKSLDELKENTVVIWHDDVNVLYQQF